MATREIVKAGDPVLKKVSRRVDEITPRILTLLDDMRDTLIDAQGAGLAAVQVGVLRRVVVIYMMMDGENGSYVEMINPEIIGVEDEQIGIEGCLSLPGEYGIVTRPGKVRACYLNRNGERCEIEGEGMTARAICHEIDHLDGVMYTERAERMLTPEELEELENDDDDEYENE